MPPLGFYITTDQVKAIEFFPTKLTLYKFKNKFFFKRELLLLQVLVLVLVVRANEQHHILASSLHYIYIIG